MNGSSRRIGVITCLVGLTLPLNAQDSEFFEKEVRPILANRCYACHGPHAGEGQAGLRLDSLAGMLEGGRSGPVIVPGEPTRSLLIHAINHDTFVQMPPKTKLPLDEVRTLTRWVEIGEVHLNKSVKFSGSCVAGETEPRTEVRGRSLAGGTAGANPSLAFRAQFFPTARLLPFPRFLRRKVA